ncbi:MAG: tetratricopeptide repeat protein [Tyzzerella sp.]|nr:tetratricopeptide repeat protein [Tyzzerella sp.]
MKRKGFIGLIILMVLLSGCASNIREGVSLLEEGKYEDAVAKFQEDIDKEKNLDEAYRGMGIAYYEQESYAEAADCFKTALENKAEETASIYHLLGTCYLQTADYENAVSNYNKALAMEDCTEEMKKEMLFNKIAAYENLADWESAKTAVSEYLEAYPDDERAIKEAEFLETR